LELVQTNTRNAIGNSDQPQDAGKGVNPVSWRPDPSKKSSEKNCRKVSRNDASVESGSKVEKIRQANQMQIMGDREGKLGRANWTR